LATALKAKYSILSEFCSKKSRNSEQLTINHINIVYQTFFLLLVTRQFHK